MSTSLPPVIAEHFDAVNAFDVDRIVATFTVTPWSTTCIGIPGTESIRCWVGKRIRRRQGDGR